VRGHFSPPLVIPRPKLRPKLKLKPKLKLSPRPKLKLGAHTQHRAGEAAHFRRAGDTVSRRRACGLVCLAELVWLVCVSWLVSLGSCGLCAATVAAQSAVYACQAACWSAECPPLVFRESQRVPEAPGDSRRLPRAGFSLSNVAELGRWAAKVFRKIIQTRRAHTKLAGALGPQTHTYTRTRTRTCTCTCTRRTIEK